ncbi:MAG TPA: hypothetical protein PKN22_05165 [Taishania sp.]|nr:hypothetical protein [Taishania sp.]
MDYQVELRFKKLTALLNKDFDGDMDISGILFLIGVNELGWGFKNYSKDEKMDLVHIATCTILAPYGYYELEGKDQDNWPHFKLIKKLPHLEYNQQQHLMKEAIIDYFISNGYYTKEQITPTFSELSRHKH